MGYCLGKAVWLHLPVNARLYLAVESTVHTGSTVTGIGWTLPRKVRVRDRVRVASQWITPLWQTFIVDSMLGTGAREARDGMESILDSFIA